MGKSLLDAAWVVVASSLVFIMQAGFAMLESGLTRSKNSINVAIKNLTDLGISVLCFWLAGYALMFGPSIGGLIGAGGFAFDPQANAAEGWWPMVFFLFQAMFCSTAATIVSGAVAERMRYLSYIISTAFMSLAVYPVFGHWAWGGALEGRAAGWLARLGFVDFAGSTVVHSVGGWVSLAALLVIGPRAGRFAPDGKPASINASSVPLAVLGAMILWFGWIGFNGGSTLAMNGQVAGIVVRTTLAAAAGMAAALAAGWPLLGRPDVGLVLNGTLAGLVGITASCHAVSYAESVLIGASSALAALGIERLLLRLRIDDAVGAIPVHLGAGIWGTLCVGLFGSPEALGTGLGRGGQVLIQLAGIGACGAWCFGSALAFMLVLNKISRVRVSAADEFSGLNKAEHGVTTEIHDLFAVMDEQSRTGDISLRAPEEPFTEAGQIARMYNRAMDRLEGSTVEKSQYLALLENIGEGMFLLGTDRKVEPYYSAALERILRRSGLAGLGMQAMLAPLLDSARASDAAGGADGAQIAASLPDFLDFCFDPSFPWEKLDALNPLREIEVDFDTGAASFERRYLRFEFKRVMRAGAVARLFVTVRDATEKRALENEMERSKAQTRSEMEMLYRIVKADRAVLAEYIEGARLDAEAINRELQSEGDPAVYRLKLEEIFRLSHAIKGDSDTLGLDFIADLAEGMETAIKSALAKAAITAEEFLAVALAFGGLKLNLEKLSALAEDYLTGTASAQDDTSWSASLRQSIEALAARLGQRCGKRISMDFRAEAEVLSDFSPLQRKALKDIAVQLTRNAIYHGIEMPTERREAGKSETGRLSLSIRMAGNSVLMEFEDDGRGLDIAKIGRIASDKGLLDPSAKHGQAMIARLIFSPGFSTADSDDRTAGKGIGLSLVAELAKKQGWRLGMSSRRGRGCAFSLRMPLERAV
jgi:Amt family ammonium transporter